MPHVSTHTNMPANDHESSEPNLAPIVKFGVVLVALCAVAFLLMRWMFVALSSVERPGDAPRHPLALEREIPPDPRLQSIPGVHLEGAGALPGEQPFSIEDLSDSRRKEDQALHSYGWIDRQAGIVHIPIEQAIEVTLRKGLPFAEQKPKDR